MARVVVQRTWPDGENLLIEIHVAASYPDSIDEAKQAALKAFEGALDIVHSYDMADDDADEDVL